MGSAPANYTIEMVRLLLDKGVNTESVDDNVIRI